MVNLSSQDHAVLRRIKEKRQELLELGSRYELTHQRVLKCSQELDMLLNFVQVVESDLRRGIKENQFILHYQPKVDPRTRKIVGAEALIRWEHPEWGLTYPNKFIPLAEETHLIIDLGDWVIANVCRQIKQWQMDGYKLVPISINISAKRFIKDNLAATLQQLLIDNGIGPEWIELEITETSLIQNEDSASSALKVFKKMGVAVSLDDFGTGYSSISYLKKFKVDYLKIDRSFIIGIGVDRDDEALIRTMLYLARELNMQVVAEGVETYEQLRFLMKHRCNLIQGYLYSKPIEEDQFTFLLSKGRIPTPTFNSNKQIIIGS